MKKKLNLSSALSFLLAFFTALMIPLGASASDLIIINQTLPEASSGVFYSTPIFATGLDVTPYWSADDLPQGLEIGADTGIVNGIPTQSGEYIVRINVGSRSSPHMASKLFVLTVKPEAALPETAPPAKADIPDITVEMGSGGGSASMPEPQATGTQDIIQPAAVEVIGWPSITVNGESRNETTTKLYLEFNSSNLLKFFEDDPYDYFLLTGADITGINLSGNIVTLNISLKASVDNGGKIIITILDWSNPAASFAGGSEEVTVYVFTPLTDREKAELDADMLDISVLLGNNDDEYAIIHNLVLPREGQLHNCAISWESNNAVISNDGVVVRSAYSDGDKPVTLTATITCGGETVTRSFDFIVKAQPQPEDNTGDNPQPDSGNPQVDGNINSNPSEITPSTSNTYSTSESRSSTITKLLNGASAARISSANVSIDGTVNSKTILSELSRALKESLGGFAAVKTKNALSISAKTLREIAKATEDSAGQAVIYADTTSKSGAVDCRLYLKPEAIPEGAAELKLTVSTTGSRPERTKKFFEKYFENEVNVISCAQQGDFGARLQIAARVKLPENTDNLAFYSYDAESNTFTRIITAYRIDSNGYLHFATKKAGDIIVSDGALKKKIGLST